MVNDIFTSLDILQAIKYWAELVERTNKCGNLFRPYQFKELDGKTKFTASKSFGIKCCKELIKLHGIIGFENYDSDDLDRAVQMVVFGKIIYG